MKQIKVRQTWHHESSVSSLSRFTMGNVSSITSLKRIPIDVLFRPARRPEYTVYSSPHFQVQRSTNLSSDFHFNSHFKACKRLRLPFHYWPINSTISGSVTSIWKPSKTWPTKRPLRSAACVCLGCIHCPWLAHCNLCQMVSQLLFLWEAQREELRGLHRFSEEKNIFNKFWVHSWSQQGDASALQVPSWLGVRAKLKNGNYQFQEVPHT